jgi:hypothetical protein
MLPTGAAPAEALPADEPALPGAPPAPGEPPFAVVAAPPLELPPLPALFFGSISSPG